MWFCGLILFAAKISSYVEPQINESLAPTQAIVVLTGGSERLTTGIDLLRAGKGKKLLISGVYPGVGMNRVLAHADVPEELQSCCIILGHAADNTIGNAEETKTFMADEHFTSLRLVTSHYHMPRSLLVFQREMPDTEIIPYPVTPESVKVGEWWSRWGTASLLIVEYNKYLVAWLRAALEV